MNTMKRLILFFTLIFILAGTANTAVAGSTHAASVVDYGDSYFMNWDSINGFYHNVAAEYPDAGADLEWLLGPEDVTVAAGWGGDANGGYLAVSFDTPFISDGTGNADIIVYGFGFAYNTPFSLEKGAVKVYASDDGESWTVISDYAGYDNGAAWGPNPDFTESNPGVPSTVMSIDLDDDVSNKYTGAVSFLKFELGDGAEGHGRAFFASSIEGVKAYHNSAPTADAGSDQSVDEGSAVSLDGTGSYDPDDGDVISYEWVQTGADEFSVDLSDSSSAAPSFTAPDVGVEGAVLTFRLTVSDGEGLESTDQVSVNINFVNLAPAARAGSDQTVDENVSVTIDGTASYDPDAGDTITYRWEQTDSSGYNVSLSDSCSGVTSFLAPDVGAGGAVLTFRLVVADAGGLESYDDVNVAVAFSNRLPSADAGADQSVDEGEDVTLDGTGSFDPDNGDSVTYEWMQIDSSGYPVNLSDSESASPGFTAPDVGTGGAILVFRLTVTDEGSLTDTDEVNININFVNRAPVSDAGADQSVDEGSAVYLDAASSSDPDTGDIITCHWEQADNSGYSVVLSDSTSGKPVFTAPDVGISGALLIFDLTVTDAGGLTDTDQVSVNINFVNKSPEADAGPDRTVSESASVTLDGTGSYDPDTGDTITYQWEQTDTSGYTVALSGADSGTPSFTVPDIDETETKLEFTLTVTDAGMLTCSDTVKVTVNKSDSSGSVFATAVTDYGSDPANMPENGIFMNWDSENGFYHNEISAYPGAGADLSLALGPVDESVAAGWGGDASGGFWIFEFEEPISSDGSESVDIAVHGFGYAYNTPFSGEKGAVLVYASSDGTDWNLVSEYAGYDNGDAWESNPDFRESAPGMPSVVMYIDLDDDVSGTFTGSISYLKFVLGDGTDGNGRAFFINAVEGGKLNVPPVANAGTDQEVNAGDAVTLDGSGSIDVDDGIASYLWEQVDFTDETRVFLDDSASVTPLFTAPGTEGETLKFELTVTDSAGQTDTDIVEVVIVSVFDIEAYYAVSVVDESGSISLITKSPDGAVNAAGLPDYVPDSEGDCSGWDDTEGYMILKFKKLLEDRAGRDDLAVAYTGTGQAEILVSSDAQDWTSLDNIISVEENSEHLSYNSFDFSGSGAESIQYVKILKTGQKPFYVDSIFVPVEIYGATAEDTDAEYPDGCVDWVAKQADKGKNSLGKPDYDDSAAGVGNCSGWMVEAGRITIGFDKPFFNGNGNDLNIYHFGQGGADVEVSSKGVEWTSLGELPAGLNGGSRLDTAGYDFDDFNISAIQYIRINKTQAGYTYGRFIDAVEGLYGVPGAPGFAGRDLTAEEGTTVVIGSEKEDNENETVSYEWLQTRGPEVVLSSLYDKNPQFITPMIEGQQEDLKFKLLRTDSDGTTEDEVKIEVVDNGMELSPSEEDIFYPAEFVFNNKTGAEYYGSASCYMGLSGDGGSLVSYEAQNPDSILSSGYINDFDNRPRNIIYGLLSFTVKTSSVGAGAVISVYLPEAAPENYRWYKYSKETGWFDFSRNSVSGGTGDGAEFNEDRTVINIHITDGGPYDDDGKADGYISDPSGLGESSTTDTWHDEGGGGCFIDTVWQFTGLKR